MKEEIQFNDLEVGTVLNIGPENLIVTIDEINETEEVFWFEHEGVRYYENTSFINSIVKQPYASFTAEKILEELGFEEMRHGEYFDESGYRKVVLAPDGIYAYTVDRNSAMDDQPDYLEMHLNFIPEEKDILTYLIKRVFYI